MKSKHLFIGILLALMAVSCGGEKDDAPEKPEPKKTLPGTARMQGHTTVRLDIDPCGIAATIFPADVMDECSSGRNYVRVYLKDSPLSENFYKVGNKLNSIFAIESVKLLYFVPDRDYVQIQINTGGKSYSLNTTRAVIEEYYSISFEKMKELDTQGKIKLGGKWKNLFLSKHDNPESIAEFVKSFVKQGPLDKQ